MATPSFKRGDTFTALCQREGVDITDTTARLSDNLSRKRTLC